MLCNQCGLELPKKSKPCPRCGSNNKNTSGKKDTALDTDRITKEEYMALTNIKSPEEAKKYFARLKRLFIGTFVSSTIMKIFSYADDSSDLSAFFNFIFFVLTITILIYFIIYSVKVLKAEKLSKIYAGFCIILAPMSWLWFYPYIMDPLKIILGEKKPPLRSSLNK